MRPSLLTPVVSWGIFRVACGLRNVRASAVATNRLRCSEASESLSPQLGISAASPEGPLQLSRWVVKHWASREVPLAKLDWRTRCQKSYILAYPGGLYVSDVVTLDKPVSIPVPRFPSLVTLSLVPLRCPWMEWEWVCKSAKWRRKPAEGNVRKTGFSHVFSRHKAWGVLKIQVMQTVQCPVPISGRDL